ncbi:MAG: hypothetical protein ABI946_05765 [Chthoniobacterales bacterium]
MVKLTAHVDPQSCETATSQNFNSNLPGFASAADQDLEETAAAVLSDAGGFAGRIGRLYQSDRQPAARRHAIGRRHNHAPMGGSERIVHRIGGPGEELHSFLDNRIALKRQAARKIAISCSNRAEIPLERVSEPKRLPDNREHKSNFRRRKLGSGIPESDSRQR